MLPYGKIKQMDVLLTYVIIWQEMYHGIIVINSTNEIRRVCVNEQCMEVDELAETTNAIEIEIDDNTNMSDIDTLRND